MCQAHVSHAHSLFPLLLSLSLSLTLRCKFVYCTNCTTFWQVSKPVPNDYHLFSLDKRQTQLLLHAPLPASACFPPCSAISQVKPQLTAAAATATHKNELQKRLCRAHFSALFRFQGWLICLWHILCSVLCSLALTLSS